MDPTLQRTAKRRRDHRASEDNDGDDSISSVESTCQDYGKWGGDEDVPWNGCVCGQVHARPIPVYWIQCEGPCSEWFNVTPQCVKGMTAVEAEQAVWNCRKCTRFLQKQAAFQKLLQLPHDVLYRILQFAASPTHRAAVLCHSLAPLSKSARQFIQGDKSRGLWEAILQQEYWTGKQRGNHVVSPKRASSRRRKRTDFWAPCPSIHSLSHPRHLVEVEHALLVTRTEDVYYQVEELADPSNNGTRQQRHVEQNKNKKQQSLTLTKLRQILQKHAPLQVNRVSSCTGRTLLQVVCAGEMAENVVVACAQHLLKDYQADPNQLSTQEEPYCNRPTLFFAVARAMPNLVQLLLDSGADPTIAVQGRFKRTFDTSQTIEGCYTPYQYALAMKQVEVAVPPYWSSRLNCVIKILANADAGQ
jgi:hypothetical protein